MISAAAFVIGTVSGGLLGLAAIRIFRSPWPAAAAVALFLSAPLVSDGLWRGSPLPLEMLGIAGWLVAMQLAVERTAWWPALCAGALAGAGLYTRTGAMVTMPLLVMVGALAITQSDVTAARGRRIGALVGAFLVAAIPLLVRHGVNPDLFRNLVLAHGLYDASRFNVLQGLREIFSWVGLVARSEVYYDFFNPALWFLSGASVREHVADPRAFVIPYLVLVPAGVFALIRRPSLAWLVLGAIAVAPVPVALLARRPAVSHLLPIATLVTLVAVAGAMHLVSSPNGAVRRLGYIVSALVPLALVAAWIW